MKSVFIESVAQLLRGVAPDPETQPITAAKAGSVIRRKYGEAVWRNFGYASLKQLLQEMEKEGYLRIGRTSKDALAIQLGASGDFNLAPPQPENNAVSNTYRQLRKVFWVAFALEHPKGKRFVNSTTGEIRFGLDEAPEPSQDWIEFQSIAPESQKIWARKFLTDKHIQLDDAVSSALAADDWYKKFPKVLNDNGGPLLQQWNRVRSRNVATEVENWCKKNGLAIDTAFQSQTKRPEIEKNVVARKVIDGLGAEDAWARKVVLDALSQAPIETLLELSVPIKFVLSAISKNKSHQ